MTEPARETRPSTVPNDRTEAAAASHALSLGVSGMAALAASVAVLTAVLPLGVGYPGRVGVAGALSLVGTVTLASAFRRLGTNVGGHDRSARFVFGAVLVGAGALGAADLRLAVGLYLAVVGVAGLAGGRPVVGTGSLVAGGVAAVGPVPLPPGAVPSAFVSGVLVLVGVVTLATAVAARCPVNLALGIDTCPRATGD